METQRRQWYRYKCFNIANQVTIYLADQHINIFWSTYFGSQFPFLQRICFNGKRSLKKVQFKQRKQEGLFPILSSCGRNENLNYGKIEGNEKTYNCKVWCLHCAKCKAQISSCLKGSQKARVIAFVEGAASFTKFQVNI